VSLPAISGYDCVLCANPASPRCGLLTFEHIGCKQTEPRRKRTFDVSLSGLRQGSASPGTPDATASRLCINAQILKANELPGIVATRQLILF
jgi:hypothetical protein